MQYRSGAFAGAAGRLRDSGLQGSLVASGCQWLRTCPCLCVGCCIGVAARERGSAPMAVQRSVWTTSPRASVAGQGRRAVEAHAARQPRACLPRSFVLCVAPRYSTAPLGRARPPCCQALLARQPRAFLPHVCAPLTRPPGYHAGNSATNGGRGTPCDLQRLVALSKGERHPSVDAGGHVHLRKTVATTKCYPDACSRLPCGEQHILMKSGRHTACEPSVWQRTPRG